MHYIENEKGKISDLNHRLSITKVRGGWNEKKIVKELKHKKSDSIISFHKEIAKFDNPEDFGENLFYHGSGSSISILKPSIVLGDTTNFGGGFGEKYYAVSLSKDKNIASNFTGVSHFGNVAPVVLKRGAVVKKMPELTDSESLNDIIVDLWEEGVDAVILGDHSKEHSEQEIAILNPRCIAVGPSESFKVFKKAKMPSMTKDEIENLWIDSSSIYEKRTISNWERRNQESIDKKGEGLNPEFKISNKQVDLLNFHRHNVELHKNKLNIKQDLSNNENTVNEEIKDDINSTTTKRRRLKP